MIFFGIAAYLMSNAEQQIEQINMTELCEGNCTAGGIHYINESYKNAHWYYYDVQDIPVYEAMTPTPRQTG